jgi:hypothetical protein
MRSTVVLKLDGLTVIFCIVRRDILGFETSRFKAQGNNFHFYKCKYKVETWLSFYPNLLTQNVNLGKLCIGLIILCRN